MAIPPDKFDIYRQIVERAWADPAFRERFKADPRTVLGEYGVTVSESEEIEVVEDPQQFHLPQSPEGFIC